MQDEMVRFYEAFRREVPRARLLVVTRDQPTELRALLARFGAEGELVHRSAKRDEVAKFVRCADAALCFVRPTFSKLGSAPTKVGAILGCGLPVAANIVGDLDRVLGESPAGVVVSDMSEDALARAARQLADAARRPTTRSEARAVAERWFGLEAAVAAYDRIYEAIGSARGARADATWPSESRFRPHSATNVL
jgi:glycosyltransferase involved in cell wall biosynthesis